MLVCSKEWENNRETNRNGTQRKTEPDQADTATEGHTDENESKNQGNAGVLGYDHVQTEQQTQMEHHVHNRGDCGYSVLVRGHDRCHDDDVGDFTNFSRLNIDDGGFNPASVTGVVVRAEGNQKQQQERIEYHQQIPVLGHNFHVDGGYDSKGKNADDRCTDLNGDVAEVTAEFLCGSGTADNDTSERRGNEAQKKQHPVALLGEIF